MTGRPWGVWWPRSRRAAVLAAVALIFATSILASLAAFVLAGDQAGDAREEIIKAQIGGCERAKDDRIDNARGWTQRAHDARHEANEQASEVYAETANQLRSRLFYCDPLIRTGREIVDEAALAEAKGEL